MGGELPRDVPRVRRAGSVRSPAPSPTSRRPSRTVASRVASPAPPSGRSTYRGRPEWSNARGPACRTPPNLESAPGKSSASLAVGGLEHRHASERRVVAAVLLVLGRMHPRIVRDHDHQTAADSSVREREERVGRHVEPDMLHGDQRPATSEARPGAYLEGDLLVRRPFGRHVRHCGEGFQNLGRRRARVARTEVRPRPPRRPVRWLRFRTGVLGSRAPLPSGTANARRRRWSA